MPARKYSLRRGDSKRIAISWSSSYTPYLVVRLDGKIIGTIPSKEALAAGREFRLDDGSLLRVRGAYSELHVSRNNQPLPGSSSDPLQTLKSTYWTIFVFSGICLLLGLAVSFIPDIEMQIWGKKLFVNGLILLVLGFFVSQASVVALSLTIALCVLDAFFLLVPGNAFTIIIYIALIVKLLGGFQAIQEIRSAKAIDRKLTVEPPVEEPENFPVSISPARDAENTPETGNLRVAITYSGPLAIPAESITMHWGYNNWRDITDIPMSRENASSWQVTITVPASATVLNMAFYSQDRTWDNRQNNDYHLGIWDYLQQRSQMQ